MTFSTQTPQFLWPEAVAHATYLRNRSHTRALESKTPLEAWCGCKPDVSHLQEFGSPVWILNEGQLTKLQPRSTKHTFVGFIDGPKAIRYYDASTRQVHVSCNFQFPLSQTWPNTGATPPHEKPAQGEGESAPVGTENVPDETDTTDIHPESNAEGTKRKGTNARQGNDETSVRRSKRQKRTHDYRLLDDPWADGAGTTSGEIANMTSAERVYAASNKPSATPDNPKDLRQARESSDWPDWEKAIQAKLDQLHKMGTWELVDPPEGHTLITNKWVLTKKYDKDGNLQKYKARLVARGYSQQPVSCTKHVWYSEHGTYYRFKIILEQVMSATHVAVIPHMRTSPAYEEEFTKMDYPDARNGYGMS